MAPSAMIRNRPVQQLVRTVGSKTFPFKTASGPTAPMTRTSKRVPASFQAFSDAHFALLKAIPGLAAYTAWAIRLLVILDIGKR